MYRLFQKLRTVACLKSKTVERIGRVLRSKGIINKFARQEAECEKVQRSPQKKSVEVR